MDSQSNESIADDTKTGETESANDSQQISGGLAVTPYAIEGVAPPTVKVPDKPRKKAKPKKSRRSNLPDKAKADSPSAARVVRCDKYRSCYGSDRRKGYGRD